jgi:hypothetical protein
MKKVHYIHTVLLLIVTLYTQISAQTATQVPLLESPKTIRLNESIKTTEIPPRLTPTSVLPPGDLNSDRKVFWCHGFGGGESTFDRASAATQNTQSPPVVGYAPRKITSHPMSYSGSYNSVSGAASNLKTKIETIAATQTAAQKARNAVIGQSLGGVVTQYIDYLYDTEGEPGDRAFYGLVTVGTSTKGAPLADNSYPFAGSKAHQFSQDLAKKLLAGPTAEALANSFALRLVWNFTNGDQLLNSFIDNYTDNISTMIYKNFNAPIASDLKTTSPAIATISGFTPNITRRVAFAGRTDNTDLIWKTYHYMKNSPNGYGYFEARNSHTQETIDNMNKNKAKYKEKVDYWDAKVDHWNSQLWMCYIPSSPSIVYCLGVIQPNLKKAKETRDAWAQGLAWWEGANDGWRLLCGDLAFVNNPQGACKCYDYNPATGQSSAPYPSSNCTTTFNLPVYKICSYENTQNLVDVDSDGIVPLSSQVALPGATTTVMMEGNTHFQEVNSPELKDALNKLWNGNWDDFFITNPR